MRGMASGPEHLLAVGGGTLTLALDNTSLLDSTAVHLLLSEDWETCHLDVTPSSREYWRGLLPYLVLHLPPEYTLMLYSVATGQQAYGLEESGFALLSAGSAAFIPYQGAGAVHCFAGSDTFMMLQEITTAWDAAGRPDTRYLRLQLVPADRDVPLAAGVKSFPRQDHTLRMWLEDETG
jgi:hypothetical protein